MKIKCPKCDSTHISTERRMDGDSTCLDCRYKDKTDKFCIEKSIMTPEKFRHIRSEQQKNIREAYKKIKDAEDSIEDNPEPPKNLRKATSKDIIKGNILWYNRDHCYWKIIDEVNYPSGSFKAYTAHDGCRYGLDGAYVEILSQTNDK